MPYIDEMKYRPDQLCEMFSDLVNGTGKHGGLSAADIVHTIVEDVIDSMRLSLEEGIVVFLPEEVDGLLQPVIDYYNNHYGEL